MDQLTGDPFTSNNQRLKHYNEIMNSLGKFRPVTNNKGIKFREKWLPDGRGLRLNGVTPKFRTGLV